MYLFYFVLSFHTLFFFFFFNDTATTEIYTLSLHDALPILAGGVRRDGGRELRRGGVPCRALPRRDARRRWALAQRELALRPPRRHPLQYPHGLGVGRGGSPTRSGGGQQSRRPHPPSLRLPPSPGRQRCR